ncbi:MAG: hypothetical protein O3B00_04715 [archaeon]|nr:hypothetical protein [archaeon]MDA1130784.1 hypothetical protein [archaeon]
MKFSMNLLNSTRILFLLGFLVGFGPVIMSMLSGLNLEDALFEFAYYRISDALTVRAFEGYLLPFGLIAFFIKYKLFQNENLKQKISRDLSVAVTQFLIGYLMAFSALYLMLDFSFFFGSVRAMPFVLGFFITLLVINMLLTDTILLDAIKQSIKEKKSNLNKTQIFAVIEVGLLLAAGLALALPNTWDMSGFAPDQPQLKLGDWGNMEAQYSVIETSIPVFTSSPEFQYWPADDDGSDWKVHVFIPIITDSDLDSKQLGVAIYLHGYSGEDVEVYRDTLELLASRGLVVIFPQYISDLDLSSIDKDFKLIYEEGGSNHPQHQTRYDMAWLGITRAISALNTTADGELAAILQQHTGTNTSLNLENLWIGGHSMGGGTTFSMLDRALDLGWGSSSLQISLEAPWIHAQNGNPLRGNMSKLPDHTWAQITEYSSDYTVHPCQARWQHDRISQRDSSFRINDSQVQYLRIESDYYGFPRMMASHFIQASFIHDNFADLSYYSRIDAQAARISTQPQLFTADSNLLSSAQSFLSDENQQMTNLGDWSDGHPVNGIKMIQQPLQQAIADGSYCTDAQ